MTAKERPPTPDIDELEDVAVPTAADFCALVAELAAEPREGA